MARLAGLLGGSLLLAGAEPEEVTDKPARIETPPYTVTPTEIQLPGVVLDRRTGEVRLQAEVCLKSGILAGLWPNPTTVIQYGLPSGNPYEGEEQGMEIREERVPEPGTPVTLIFSRAELPSPPVREESGTAEPEE